MSILFHFKGSGPTAAKATQLLCMVLNTMLCRSFSPLHQEVMTNTFVIPFGLQPETTLFADSTHSKELTKPTYH